ncbi:MAG TPA: hypothetical protein VKP69_14900, partial [Isosphaeraceae bacterium]|nr:hypothetical protein [Isosphaeraceae bacterium]
MDHCEVGVAKHAMTEQETLPRDFTWDVPVRAKRQEPAKAFPLFDQTKGKAWCWVVSQAT